MLKRQVLKPTKIHNGVEASASSSSEKTGKIKEVSTPATNPVINDMIHKLSERMNSAQVEVHLLVNDMDDVADGSRKKLQGGGNGVDNGREIFNTPRMGGGGGGEKTAYRPPISNIDSVSLPSSRSSSFSSATGPVQKHLPQQPYPDDQLCEHHQRTAPSTNNEIFPLTSSTETVVPVTSASDYPSNSNLHHHHQCHGDRPPPSVLQQQTIDPFLPRSGSNVETVYKNYEMLVTRLCSLESTIQSLKLKLASKEVMRECKECFKKSEKLNHLNDAFEKDLHGLRSLVFQSKGEVQNERVLRQSAEIRVKHAESMLDSNGQDKVELSEKLSSMNEDVINLRRMVAEAGREVEAERTVRMRLEESHSLLLKRIQEMDSAVDSERKTVSSLSVEAIDLRKKTTSMDQQMTKARRERTVLEDQLKRSKTELTDKINDLLKSEADRHKMVDQLKDIQSDMNSLYQQNQEAQAQAREQTSLLREMEDQKKSAAQELRGLEADYSKLSLELDTLRPKVGDLSDKNVRMLQEVETLKRSNEVLNKDNDNKNNDVLNLRKSFTKLNEDLKKAVVSKESLEQNAQSILRKLDHKADAVEKEKSKLGKAVEEKDGEIAALMESNTVLDREVKSLRERVVLLQQQEISHEQLQGLMDRCAQLSYEKGELESQVEQYRERSEEMESLKLENEILENEKTETGEKLSALERQVKLIRENCEQLKHQLMSERRVTEQKEEDFQLAMQARDEAAGRVVELREALRKIQNEAAKNNVDFQSDLENAKKDGSMLAASLEKVVNSHAQLQATVEELKRELGRKDGVITKREDELKTKTESESQLKHSLAKARADFTNLDYQRETEVDAVKRELRVMMEDNKKLATSLQLMINANDELRAAADYSQGEIETLQMQLEQSIRDNEEEKNHHQSSYENNLNKLEKEKDSIVHKMKRKQEKELNEVKAENSKLASRCVELRKTVDSHVEESEKLRCNVQVQKDKLGSQRNQIKALNSIKEKYESALEKISELERDLEKTEKSRKSLEKNVKIQEGQVGAAQDESSRLKDDLTDVIDRQREKSDAALTAARAEVVEEKEKYLALKAKYKTVRKSEKELRELNEETAQKLQSAHDESLQISTHLKEAGEWFRIRFDELQRELLDAQRYKDTISKERKGDKRVAQQEKKKIEEVMGTASAMLAASQVAVTRLTDEAEQNQHVARQQLLDLQTKMRHESDRARAMEDKYRTLKESSARHVESLAQELAAVKNEGPVEEMVHEFETILSSRRRGNPRSISRCRSKDRRRSSFATSTPNDKKASSAQLKRKPFATEARASPTSPSDTPASSNDDEDSNEFL